MAIVRKKVLRALHALYLHCSVLALLLLVLCHLRSVEVTLSKLLLFLDVPSKPSKSAACCWRHLHYIKSIY